MSDKSERFDRAFSKDDDTLALLKRVLGCFDLDMFQFPSNRFMVRLWDEGECIAEREGDDLENVLRELDKDAAAIANYG